VDSVVFARIDNDGGSNRDNHAERHILRELLSAPCLTNAKLLAIGATNQVCTTCFPAIAASSWEYAVAVPTQDGQIS
jgi:hypothetical protein